MGRRRKKKFKKTKRLLIFVFIFTLFYQLIVRIGYDDNRQIKWGMAFSKPYAEELGLDWKKVYSDMIDDLGIKVVRLPFYWNDIEKVKGVYDFEDYDWMMSEAESKGVEILPVVGKRLPRWPECHEPEWYGNLDQLERKKELLAWVELVVKRYVDYENISMWQVENEPFLKLFGKCEKPDVDLINKEVELVKYLTNKSVLITDSGELSTWYKSSRQGDYLGSTVYRVVHNPIIGYWNYWFMPSSFYRFKARVNFKSLDKTIVSELQTEPWYPNEGSIFDTPLEEQSKSMNVEKFQKNIEYAQKIGFSEVYLWGVEWWWWLKEVKDDDRMWESAKKVFE